MSEPEPFVPANVDVRDFPYVPVFRGRLFASSFHARTSDAEWRAGVTLWLKSWDQVPGGSLPSDDIDLCRLAELGRDQTTWLSVKTGALRGWQLCSDGRLHHAVVAEGVLEADAKRKIAKTKGLKGAQVRWENARAGKTPGTSNGVSIGPANAPASEEASSGRTPANAQAMPGDGKRRELELEVEGEERQASKAKNKADEPQFVPPDWISPESWSAWLAVRKKKKAGNEASTLQLAVNKLEKWRDAGHDPQAIVDSSVLSGWPGLFEPKPSGATAGVMTRDDWWASDAGIARKAKEVGVSDRNCRSFGELREKVNAKLREAPRVA